MTDGRVALNGTGPHTIYMNTYRTGQQGNQSDYRSYGYYESNNNGATWTYNTQYWSAWGGGMNISGTFTIPNSVSILLYDHYWSRGHDAAGNGSAFDTCHSIDTDHTSIGDGTVCVHEGAPPRIPKVPAQMGAPGLSAPGESSMTASFSAPDNMGSGISSYDLQWADNSGFSNPRNFNHSGSPITVYDLSSGTVWYFRVRANNGVGAGPWSGASSKRTLPAVPNAPTLSEMNTDSILANWNDITGATTGYDLQWSTNSSFSGAAQVTSPDSIERPGSLQPATRYYFRVRAGNDSGVGGWSGSSSQITKPVAPTGLVLSAPSTLGMTANWKAAPNGPEISSYDVQWDDNSSFSSPVTVNSPDTVEALTGMIPGTTHYVRVRAKNSSGDGAWSNTASQTTLPAVPPGMTVSASPDGRSATISFSPPGGVTGVTRYDWEWRVVNGPGSPGSGIGQNGVVYTQVGLNPGTTYEWRGSAWIGTYQSPWTGWTALTQPNPNVSPGDFFDGNTPDTGDVDYGWTGAANNSTSTATAKGVTGWKSYYQNGCSGTLSQGTGGRNGSKAARITIKSDATAPGGMSAGTDNKAVGFADVVGDGYYYGSMYVRVSRAQLLQLSINWYDELGANLGSMAKGIPVLVPANTWTRVTANGPAHDDALFATLRVEDVAGTGQVNWQGGDIIDLDSAMITLGSLFPYFDGSFADTAEYDYAWLGTDHASVSTRTTLDQSLSAEDPLNDPECADIPQPPKPPVVPAECIDEIGVWRRYWAVISQDLISSWLEVIPTVTVTSGRGTEDPDPPLGVNQVRIRYYENPDNLTPEDFIPGEWAAEQIISYMPPFTTITIDGVSQRTWAEVDGGAPLPADRLLYGSEGVPATWPVLSCNVGYLITFDTPLDVLVGNVHTGVALTERLG